MASVHPVLKASSWRISVLIQTERQIDRRCPLSDRRIIRCYCLRYSSSEIHPTHLEIGCRIIRWCHLHFARCVVYQVHRRLHLWYRCTVDSSDDVFFLPFLRVFNLDLCFNLTYLTCHHLSCAWYVNVWYDMLTWAWYVNLCMVC
jgi:hypothetical protein